MSDTETEKFRQIGINLINEYRQQGGLPPIDWLEITTPKVRAFIRSIQLHEKTKQELADCKQELSDFRQKVSDALEQAQTKDWDAHPMLWCFLIPKAKPDPIAEAWVEATGNTVGMEPLNAALEARGFEIREKSDG